MSEQPDLSYWMSEFASLEALYFWLRRYKIAGEKIEFEIAKAWESRRVALELGVPKDYHLQIQTRLDIRRRGPKQPTAYVRKKERLALKLLEPKEVDIEP